MINIASLWLVDASDEVLRMVCAPVPEINDEVRAVARRMLEILMACKNPSGIGLSAPQVGVPWRMFVTISPLRYGVFINPEFSRLHGHRRMEIESCLTLPGRSAGRTRHTGAEMWSDSITGSGERVLHRSASPLEARCWQHEVDHLNGRQIIDGDMPSEYGGGA